MPICSSSNCSLLPSLTVHALYFQDLSEDEKDITHYSYKIQKSFDSWYKLHGLGRAQGMCSNRVIYRAVIKSSHRPSVFHASKPKYRTLPLFQLGPVDISPLISKTTTVKLLTNHQTKMPYKISKH